MNDAQEAINEYPKLNFKFKSLGKILPDYTVKFIQDISDDVLELFAKDKIEGIIIDVDETLRDNMQDLSLDIKEWLKRLSHKFKVVVLSNGNDYKVKEDLDSIDIKYISGAYKPITKYFEMARKYLDLPSDKILVIGDSMFDDIFGGKLAKMKTLWIRRYW